MGTPVGVWCPIATMQLGRMVGIVDLGVAAVIAVLIALPSRQMYATPVFKADPGAQFAVAIAEARTIARPADGQAVADLTRALDEAGQKDWAIDEAVRGSERAKASPSLWRALFAASGAFVERLDVIRGLDYANRALAACRASRRSEDGCPSWEEVRLSLFQQSLDAGVRAGIDPRRNPRGFREALDKGMLQIHLTPHDKAP